MNQEKQRLKTKEEYFPELNMNDEEYLEYFNQKLKKSQDDIKNGRTITLEEFDRKMEELYASYSIKWNRRKHE